MRKSIALIAACLFVLQVFAGEKADSLPSKQLEEVVVTGQSARQRLNNVRLGAESLDLSKFASVPSLFGEADLLKSLSLMPGVRSEGEASSGFEVRGGTAWQNLVTLDGITLYNPSHVAGIFSMFNDAAVGRATLFKGPIPAAYGGASSSVLETSLAVGDMESYRGSATVGILASKIAASGPIVKNKLSFAVAARRSYFDMFLKMTKDYKSTVMNFYDVSAKLRLATGSGGYVDGSFIISHDNMALKGLMGMDWGNIGGSVNWRATAGDRLSFITTAAVTHYSPDMGMDIMDTRQEMNQYIHTYSVNEKGRYAFSENHSLEFGLRSELYRVRSCEINLNDNLMREERSGWQNAVWVNWDGRFGSRFELSAGARLSLFSALSPQRFHDFVSYSEPSPQFDAHTYVNIEPRGSLKFNLSPLHNIKVGAGVSTQNIHALRGSNSSSFPFDRYALSSAWCKPEQSVQYGLGYTGAVKSGHYDWSAEAYWRDMRNVYDYKDGASMFSSISLENIILGGRGRSYGAELMFRKNDGPLTGWVSYTISKTQTKIAGINGGRWYDATNDRRHDFAIVAIWNISRKWSVSAAWTYMTGTPITAPEAKYELNGGTCYYYSQRNSYRIPSSHKLDISAKCVWRHRRFTSQLDFGVTNAYCHYNPFVVSFRDDPDNPAGTQAIQTALYGLLPSISYTIKFNQK